MLSPQQNDNSSCGVFVLKVSILAFFMQNNPEILNKSKYADDHCNVPRNRVQFANVNLITGKWWTLMYLI